MRLAGGRSLSAAGWAAFHRRHWERRGLVLRRPLATALATPGELFRCLLQASAAYRAGDRGFGLEFCIEHGRLLADVAAHLPVVADGTAAGYARRLAERLEGRRFGLVVEDFQAFDAQLWLRMREFLRGLYELTGVPGEAAKATLFLGNYRRTPFGLHRGRSSNFMFVVEGRKRIVAWPDRFFRGKPDLTNRTDYQPYLTDAVVLEAEAGDIIYWPPDYWHVGEDLGELTAAISIALFMEPADGIGLARQTAVLLGRGDAARSSRPPAIAQRVDRAVRTLRALATGGELPRALAGAWLNHASGLGFQRVPPPMAAASLADRDVVRGDPRYPILWVRASPRTLVCAANGHDFVIAAHPRLLQLLRRLNSGRPAMVGALIAEHAGASRVGGLRFEASPADVRRLLEHLVRLRAAAALGKRVRPRAEPC